MRGAGVVIAGTFLEYVCPAILAETREGQVWVGANVPSVGGETGYSIWVVQ